MDKTLPLCVKCSGGMDMTLPLCVELGARVVSSIRPKRERGDDGRWINGRKNRYFVANTISSNFLRVADCRVAVSTGI